MTSNTSDGDATMPLRLGTGIGERRRRFADHVRSGEPLILPGVTDAMGALLVQQAGFGAAYATGAGLANAQFGLPDIGLVSLPDVVAHVGRLTGVTDLPLVVDADTGFGGPVAAARAMRALEQAGASAIQIEDQEMPKRCGHFDSHILIPAEHMQSKIAAVLAAREDPNVLLIARTDARSVHDIKEAISRGRAYREAGADIVFIEAPRTTEELRHVGRELTGFPLVVNVVEGGKTPALSFAEYRELGFQIVLYANYLMRSMMWAGKRALDYLRDHGDTTGRADQMASWQERQQLFHLPEFTTAEAHYDKPWAQVRDEAPIQR